MEEGQLDRGTSYRIAALQCAVNRAGQDGGIQNTQVDVLTLAETYLGWLTGSGETEKPVLEKMLGK